MRASDSYLARKRREIALLAACLRTPLECAGLRSPQDALDCKFKLAAALRAEQSLVSWAVTETARPPAKRWHAGPFEFSFGYQRADLTVRGAPIYPVLASRRAKWRVTTLYTRNERDRGAPHRRGAA